MLKRICESFYTTLPRVQLFKRVRAQNHNTTMVLLTSLILMTMMTSLCSGDIYTSSDKILHLADQEGELLDALQMHINAEYNNLKALSGFLAERSRATRLASYEALRQQAEHPNGAYHLIKLYTREWLNLLTENPVFDRQVTELQIDLPTMNDYHGACSALIRLQRVYQLRVDDMAAGNYSGYLGPILQADDVYEIGRQAFIDGFLKESGKWLQLAVTKLAELAATSGKRRSRQLLTKRGQACGLLGRTYLFMNDTKRAQEMYDMGSRLDNRSGDVVQLQMELEGPQETEYRSGVEAWDDNMTELCMRGKEHRVDKLKPFHSCRYKKAIGIVPYVLYKEEILSIKPYVSLFYDVVQDSEIDVMTEFVKGKMNRGQVGQGENATETYIRTSDLSWIYDDELDTATELSHRVRSITGLEIEQRSPDGPSSSEAFQVVNYGLGGHYDVHMDPFDEPPPDEHLTGSGERLATFLIYLSDVEKGGNTVFVRSKISVAPRKGMALFWYNFDPSMEKNFNTYHAGCPVLIGHKWIANKWIWTYGNTFRRPCGCYPQSTQCDIEPLMYTYHQHH